MALTSPSKTVAMGDKGRLSRGISASATTIYVSSIFKTVDGVRTKQGFDSTAGECLITLGDYTERISFEGSSVDATTKETTLTTCTRGLPVTNTTANFTGGTGRIWPKGAYISVVDAASYNQSGVYTNTTNTFTAAQTFNAAVGVAAPLTVSGTSSYLKLPELTQTQEDALTPTEGMMIKNSTTGTIRQYVGGAWASIGTDATANGSTTVAGKYEEATVAEQGSATATGATGARLVPAVANLVKTSSGAGDENKMVVLNASGTYNTGFLGTGTPDSTKFLKGDGSWGSGTSSIFGSGSDGAKTISASEDLNPSNEFNYTTLTLAVSQTLSVTSTNSPLVVHATGDVTINGTLDLNSKGAAGGTGGTTTGSGNTGTAGNSKITGYTVAGGGGGTYNAAGGGAGGGGSSVVTVGATGTAGTGAAGAGGAIIASNQLGLLASMMRGVVCGSGGGGGPGFSGNVGVAGGIGGGSSVWLIGGSLTLGASSTIRCSGGNGTSSASVPGGGGGGGGTIIILVAGSITNSGVTLAAAGGSGGTGVAATNGGAGAAGKIIIYSLSTGTIVTS